MINFTLLYNYENPPIFHRLPNETGSLEESVKKRFRISLCALVRGPFDSNQVPRNRRRQNVTFFNPSLRGEKKKQKKQRRKRRQKREPAAVRPVTVLGFGGAVGARP